MKKPEEKTEEKSEPKKKTEAARDAFREGLEDLQSRLNPSRDAALIELIAILLQRGKDA